MTDAELLAAVAEGRVDALRQLHELHAPWLASRLYRRCSDQTLVDETVQDTFTTVWRTAHRFRGEGEVAAWLWGIAIRKLIDRLRQRRVPHLDLPKLVESAEEVVLSGAAYGDLGDALQRLSPELMAVVQATILDGLTAREAGQLLGLPTGTLKTRLMKAKRMLREQLA